MSFCFATTVAAQFLIKTNFSSSLLHQPQSRPQRCRHAPHIHTGYLNLHQYIHVLGSHINHGLILTARNKLHIEKKFSILGLQFYKED